MASNRRAGWRRDGGNPIDRLGVVVGRVVDRVVPIRGNAPDVVPTLKRPDLTRWTEAHPDNVGYRARPQLSGAELLPGRRHWTGRACGRRCAVRRGRGRALWLRGHC